MTFDDLDEVHAGFVEPYMKKINEVLGHRKFDNRDEDGIKHRLREEKNQVSKEQAVYCIGVDYKIPGLFYIGSILCEYHYLYHHIYHRQTKSHILDEDMLYILPIL